MMPAHLLDAARLVSFLSLSLAAACGGAATPAPVGNRAATAPSAFLVWTQPTGNPAPPAQTRWLDADGRELGRAAGIWIAAGGGLWRLEQHTREEDTAGCQERDDGSVEPGTAHMDDLALVAPGSGERIELVQGDGDDEAAESTHTALLRASLGRFLFLEENHYVFACGAHGSSDRMTSVFDLGQRAPVKPWLTDADVAGFVDAARDQLASDADPDADPDASEPVELHHGATVPAWTGGALQARHLVWTETCYACSNGLWSSYTSGAWVLDPKVPADLAAEGAQVPPAIARLLETPGDPDVWMAGVSWGVPDDTWRTTFPAAAP